ncbi:hypothetical protein CA2015_1026 [Cyclobacterium amurskyense]|uniref:Lipoprotein n=1 Tax=Cyclobacterium amurskyense TaxID=320787 RepID=A0A0H4PBJ1_9BACT|nr:hypothetical protein CA2015_1026 [Cyclobacterium amurskyense]
MGRCHNFIYLLMLVGILTSCKKEEKGPFANPTQIDKYFPLTQFLQKSIDKVGDAEVVKEVRFNEESEIVDFRMDSLVWRQELDFFFQADINKASLASSYESIEESGLLIHRLKPAEKGTIKEIKVSKQSGKIASITILSVIDNLFYNSTVEGLIKMNDNEEISSYRLSGNQKVWFLSNTKLSVEGKVK